MFSLFVYRMDGGASLELLEGTYILYNITQKIKSAMLVLEVEPV